MSEGIKVAGNSDHPFYFVGNLLCLDFVNTEIVARGDRVDLLTGFTDVVRWLQAAALLTTSEVRTVAKRWANTAEGKATFDEAVSLRSALRAMAERIASGKPVNRGSVEMINRSLASRPAYPQLELRGSKFVSQMRALSESARHLIVPIAESAAWLLQHGDMSLLRRCENPDCILYFYDSTKNKGRRWCSMDACGSRAKAAAYYRRSRMSKR